MKYIYLLSIISVFLISCGGGGSSSEDAPPQDNESSPAQPNDDERAELIISTTSIEFIAEQGDIVIDSRARDYKIFRIQKMLRVGSAFELDVNLMLDVPDSMTFIPTV